MKWKKTTLKEGGVTVDSDMFILFDMGGYTICEKENGEYVSGVKISHEKFIEIEEAHGLVKFTSYLRQVTYRTQESHDLLERLL